jgi:hypothetical protein
MEKEFVSYELSLALKDIGYESPSPIGGYRGGAVFYYERSSELFYDGLPMYTSSYHKGQIIAPLYQQAFRWFREKYGYYYPIHRITNNTNQVLYSIGPYAGDYFTYEEAELACLIKLIEIVKNK